jgi:hypothetical protein
LEKRDDAARLASSSPYCAILSTVSTFEGFTRLALAVGYEKHTGWMDETNRFGCNNTSAWVEQSNYTCHTGVIGRLSKHSTRLETEIGTDPVRRIQYTIDNQ